jgi:hypothetical protein
MYQYWFIACKKRTIPITDVKKYRKLEGEVKAMYGNSAPTAYFICKTKIPL